MIYERNWFFWVRVIVLVLVTIAGAFLVLVKPSLPLMLAVLVWLVMVGIFFVKRKRGVYKVAIDGDTITVYPFLSEPYQLHDIKSMSLSHVIFSTSLTIKYGDDQVVIPSPGNFQNSDQLLAELERICEKYEIPISNTEI